MVARSLAAVHKTILESDGGVIACRSHVNDALRRTSAQERACRGAGPGGDGSAGTMSMTTARDEEDDMPQRRATRWQTSRHDNMACAPPLAGTMSMTTARDEQDDVRQRRATRAQTSRHDNMACAPPLADITNTRMSRGKHQYATAVSLLNATRAREQDDRSTPPKKLRPSLPTPTPCPQRASWAKLGMTSPQAAKLERIVREERVGLNTCQAKIRHLEHELKLCRTELDETRRREEEARIRDARDAVFLAACKRVETRLRNAAERVYKKKMWRRAASSLIRNLVRVLDETTRLEPGRCAFDQLMATVRNLMPELSSTVTWQFPDSVHGLIKLVRLGSCGAVRALNGCVDDSGSRDIDARIRSTNLIVPTIDAVDRKFPNIGGTLGVDDAAIERLRTEHLPVDVLLWDETDIAESEGVECSVHFASALPSDIAKTLEDTFDANALKRRIKRAVQHGVTSEFLVHIEELQHETREKLMMKLAAQEGSTAKRESNRGIIRALTNRIAHMEYAKALLKCHHAGHDVGDDLVAALFDVMNKPATKVLALIATDSMHTHETVVARVAVNSKLTCTDAQVFIDYVRNRLDCCDATMESFDGAFHPRWEAAGELLVVLARDARNDISTTKKQGERLWRESGQAQARWRYENVALREFVWKAALSTTKDVWDRVEQIAKEAVKEAHFVTSKLSDAPTRARSAQNARGLAKRIDVPYDLARSCDVIMYVLSVLYDGLHDNRWLSTSEVDAIASAVLLWFRVASKGEQKCGQLFDELCILRRPMHEDQCHKLKNFWQWELGLTVDDSTLEVHDDDDAQADIGDDGDGQPAQVVVDQQILSKERHVAALEEVAAHASSSYERETAELALLLLTSASDTQSTASAELVCSRRLAHEVLRSKGHVDEADLRTAIMDSHEAWQMPGLSTAERTKRIRALRDILVSKVVGNRKYWPTRLRAGHWRGLPRQLVCAMVYNAAGRDVAMNSDRSWIETAMSTNIVEHFWSWVVKRAGWKPPLPAALRALSGGETLSYLRRSGLIGVSVVGFGKKGHHSSARVSARRQEGWSSGRADGVEANAVNVRQQWTNLRVRLARQTVSKRRLQSIRQSVYVRGVKL